MWPLSFKAKSFASNANSRAGLWHWLPSRCAICHDWPHAPVCEGCITHFAQPQNRCPQCALPWPHVGRPCPVCQDQASPLDICLAAVTYAWPWVDLIARFKFQQQAGWSHALATLMMSTPWAEDILDKADLVLPIPLSAQRLAFRGYNQSWELAKQLSPSKADVQMLLRTRDTPSQRQLPRHERLANLVDAFAVEPLRAGQLRGKRVVLVDDVMTTGASLHMAARVLRQAGAVHVSALVLARTE
nr:ComF family protein [Limnohabitans sp. Rim8]